MINMSPHDTKNNYDKLPIILCSFSPAARDYKHVEMDAVISEKVCINIPIINNFLPGNTIQFTVTATSSSHSIAAAPSIVIIMDDGG